MKQHEREWEQGEGWELYKMEIGTERTNHKNGQTTRTTKPKHIDRGCTGHEYGEENCEPKLKRPEWDCGPKPK